MTIDILDNPLSKNGSGVNIGFIGAGRAARSLATCLDSKGYKVSSISSRNVGSSMSIADQIHGCTATTEPQQIANSCDLIFITTPDDQISSVAKTVRWHKGTGVVHCSGVESSDILSPAAERGALTGSFHPMQTFHRTSGKADNTDFENVAFSIEGDRPLMSILKDMATELGGWPVEIMPKDKAIYHISGFLACGAVTSLLNEATQLWEIIGYTKEQGLRALLPILKTTVTNMESVGPASTLTGPISRGDTGTIQKHLDTIYERAPSILPIYKQVSVSAANLSSENSSITKRKKAEILKILAN